MNLLLGFFKTFWGNFVDRIATAPMIVALCCAAVGVALAILGTPIAKHCRKTEELDDKDSIMVGCKVTGLVLLFVAVVIIVIRAGV